MIGKINYKAGTLIQLETKSELPNVGSEASHYFIKDENAFYIYSDGIYIRLKTRPTTWYISDTSVALSTEVAATENILISKLVNLEISQTATVDIGDLVYDHTGSSGMITGYANNNTRVVIRTLQSDEPRKIRYADGSWELWQSKNEGGGHYFWDSTSNILKYEGMSRDSSSPIIWESYSVIGGAADFTITGGTRVGARMFLAWDSGRPLEGSIKLFYTKNKNNDEYTINDEVATYSEVYEILASESGIYVGYAETYEALINNELSGMPAGHELSNNDWAYVLHYEEAIMQYTPGTRYNVNDIIEYSRTLYKVQNAFTATNFSTDFNNLVPWDGNSYVFIYRPNAGWTKGVIVDKDAIEPDEQKLTTTFKNKMTIKDGGVDSNAIADDAVITSKINNGAVTTDKIADDQITIQKLDNNLKEVIQKGDTMWYSDNLIVSTTQPAAPDEGYIIWINSNPDSI